MPGSSATRRSAEVYKQCRRTTEDLKVVQELEGQVSSIVRDIFQKIISSKHFSLATAMSIYFAPG